MRPVCAHLTATVSSTATTVADSTAATATSGLATASTLTLAVGIGLVGTSFGLASELDRDLALQDLLARELGNGALGLGGGGQVDECVADRTLGSRVLRDGDSLAADRIEVSKAFVAGKQVQEQRIAPATLVKPSS